MLLTEEEAKKKWCHQLGSRVPVKHSLCCASMCMAWRWGDKMVERDDSPGLETLGYCGLAGRPK